MLIVNDVDDLLGLEPRSLGHTAWRHVEQSDIDSFAAATGDDQWIHVDAQRAERGPFGRTIAHGMLTLSFVPLFAAELIQVSGAALVVNYGFDRARFVTPVTVGSRLRGEVELTGVTAVAAGVRASFSVVVAIENATAPACVAEILLQWLR